MTVPIGKARLKHELLGLFNVGPATLGYLKELGVNRIADLARQEADDLYLRLQQRRGVAFDPCLHDVFQAAIIEAKTGERRPWFDYTAERKRRQSAGDFNSLE